jgi:hypothetical protein
LLLYEPNNFCHIEKNMTNKLVIMLLSVAFLNFKPFAMDTMPGSSYTSLSLSPSCLQLEDRTQLNGPNGTATVLDCQAISPLSLSNKDDMIQKEKLPIPASELTPEILRNLKDHGVWQDAKGYQWVADVSYTDLEHLLAQRNLSHLSRKDLGEHRYEYSGCVLCQVIDPVDYKEVITRTYVQLHLRLL